MTATGIGHETISGNTKVTGLIGHPIAHSLSPAIHNAAFRALDLDYVFVPFPVLPDEGGAAVRMLKVMGVVGASVTMPHKAAAAAAVDVLSTQAAKLEAVNCIRREGDRLVGENTDGDGFVQSLRTDVAFDPLNKRCVIIGAGGAARAVIAALAEAGAKRITVVNRTAAAARSAALLAPGQVVVGEAAAVSEADLVINATSIGMATSSSDPDELARMPIDPDLIKAGQVVADLIYHPEQTALLAAAESRGAVPLGGIGMLVHQAAIAFTHWTGHEAPLEVMTAAVREKLEG